MNLSLIPTTDILAELLRRSTTMVFAATSFDECNKLLTVRSMKGECYTAYGLAMMLSEQARQNSANGWNSGVDDHWRIRY